MANLLRIPGLSEINLEFEEGELLALVGASGSGKSRLLRIIAGSTPGAQSELVSSAPSLFHSRWSVSQHFEQSLKKMLRLHRPSAAEGKHRIEQAVEWLELENCLNQKAGELSEGELKRLAIGMALVRRPRILLLDEPLQGLDAPLRTHFKTRLLESFRELGCSAIFATQDAQEAMSLGCRIAAIDSGSIQQTGTAQELYRDPATRAVGALFGMNFVEGRLDLRDGERLFAFADGEAEAVLPLSFLHSVPDVPGAEPGRGSIVIGIRPDGLQVARTPEELGASDVLAPARPGEKILPGWEAPWHATREEALGFGFEGGALRCVARVLRSEWLGRESHLLLDVGGMHWNTWAQSTDLRAGERVWVELDRDALNWFDAQGDRLRRPEIPEPAEPLPTLALEDDPSTRGLPRATGKTRRHEAPAREGAGE